jgi:hypothetical protein
MDFPQTLSADALRMTHPDYDPVIPGMGLRMIQVHTDIYEGGAAFARNIAHYLDKRAIEDAADFRSQYDLRQPSIPQRQGDSQYTKRCKTARYTPILAGKVDWIIGAVLQAGPGVVLRAPAAAAREYWVGLNSNADGRGTDLCEIAREVLRDLILFRTAYVGLFLPKNAVPAVGLGQQVQSGGLDLRWVHLDHASIDDWEYDEAGELVFVRVRTATATRVRPGATSGATLFRYYTRAGEYVYRLEDGSQVGRLVAQTPNSLGVVPIVPVAIPAGMWLAERLRDLALKHFNRDAALTYSLNQMGFSLLTITGEQGELNLTVDPDTGALILRSGDAKFVNPSPEIFKALQGDAEAKERAMDEVIQTAALSAARRDPTGRASGVSKFRDFANLTPLLQAYGRKLRDAFEKLANLAATVRNEDPAAIEITGLDRFDVQFLEAKALSLETALRLPIAETCKRWLLTDYQLALTENAPPDIRQKIAEEAQTVDVEVETPAAATPFTVNAALRRSQLGAEPEIAAQVPNNKSQNS